MTSLRLRRAFAVFDASKRACVRMIRPACLTSDCGESGGCQGAAITVARPEAKERSSCGARFFAAGERRLHRGIALTVINRLDIVTVRVAREGRIITRMIMRAYAGRAVVATACRKRGGVEGIDGGTVFRRERHM